MSDIPNINAMPYAVGNASTDTPPEPMKDTVYQVGTPKGPTKKYVSVTKIYGDRGIARCRILKSFDKSGKAIKADEGKRIEVGFEYLGKPDMFPKFATSTEAWISKASLSHDEIKRVIANCIEGYLQTEAVAYDVVDDSNKVIKGIKTLLEGYIGGFLLTFFLGFIKRRITKVIEQRQGHVPKKKTFERKVSDMKRLFSKREPIAEPEAKKAK